MVEEQLLESNGLSEYPLCVQALTHRLEGHIVESLILFQTARKLNPLNGNTLKQIGKSLYLLGKHHEALEALIVAENICAEDRDIYHDRGMCYMHLKQYEKAIEMFRTANMMQRHQSTFLQLGRVQRLMGKDEDALITYMDALDLESDNSEILCLIGLLHLKLHDNAKAFEYLGNSLTYNTKNTKSILAAGSIIQDNQDVDVALNKYRIAVIETPNSAQLWNNVGMCFFGKRKTVTAGLFQFCSMSIFQL